MTAPAPAAAPAAHALDSLTLSRGLASLSVVAFHCSLLLAATPAVQVLTDPGLCAVPFFFVLSGFVLTWSHHDGATAFWRRRWARLWPLCAICTVVSLPVGHLIGAPAPSIQLLPHLLLLQAWSAANWQGLDSPAWSLSAEAAFYLALPWLLRVTAKLSGPGLARLAGVAMSVQVLGVVAVFADPARSDEGPARYLYHFPPFNLMAFVIGICAGQAFRRGWRPPLRGVHALAVTGIGYLVELSLLAGATRLDRVLLCQVLMLPIAAMVIVCLAARDLAVTGVPSAVGQRLGRWSFALYITHYPVLQLIVWIRGDRLRGGAAGFVLLIVTVTACLAVAAAACRFVEVPLERRLRGGARPAVAVHSLS